ncbi:MAG TPA: tail fiber domain-containing protein [Bacteroidia bacterium]|nr:tail fiber domain-containing protein [Bacteroidia bacterium]
MKKSILLYSIITMTILLNQPLNAQVSVLGNIGIAGNYSGWDGAQNFPFMIRHQGRQQIQFFTDSIFRGVIDSASGFWGVGTPRPLSVLHVDTITNASAGEIFRTVGTANNQVFWRMYRGSFEYGRIYNRNDNDLYIQSPGGNMRFVTTGTQREIITDQGDVGIGSSFSSPASRLHMHNDGNNDLYFQMSTFSGNSAATDGFRIGVLNSGGSSGSSDVELRQQENFPMKFYTGDGNTTVVERFRIWYGFGGNGTGGWNNTPGITKAFLSHYGTGTPIQYMPDTVAMLNIGSRGAGNPSGGRRSWMDVGTYYNWDTDNMYTGLLDSGATNRKDAVINWGDDVQLAHDVGYESLRFIFTTCCGNGSSADVYNTGRQLGLEVARMTALGTMGIGPNWNTSLSPQGRLDIFDDGANHGGFYNTLPQLRLTQTQNANAALGNHTDFRSSTLGDLLINTQRMNGATVDTHFVGINCSLALPPLNTLEINSTALSPQLAGLRFRKLTNAATPITNTTRGVLSVNNLGDVIWVRDSISNGGTGDVIACTPLDPTSDNNFITKWTDVSTKEICRTIGIYENPANANVSIDIPVTGFLGCYPYPCTPFKLTVNGSIGIGDTGRIYKGFVGSSGPVYDRIFADEGGLSNISNLSVGNHAGPPSSVFPNIELNTFIGNDAGTSTTGEANTFLGAGAGNLLSSNTADKNTFLSYNAAVNMVSGSYNFIGGAEAAPTLDNGTSNVLIGYQAAPVTDTISSSVFVGYTSGTDIKSGSNNTMLGFSTGTNTSNARRFHATALGAESRVDVDSTVAIGTIADYVAIGTATPRDSVRLTVNAHSTAKYHENAAVFNGRVGINNYVNPAGNPIPLPIDSAVLTVRSPAPNTYQCTAVFLAGDTSIGWAGYFGGRVYAHGVFTASDANIKTNIQPLGNVQALLDPINAYTYEYNTSINSNMGLPEGTQAGFMANEIQAAFPQLVADVYVPTAIDNLGNITAPSMHILTVNYQGLIPYMFKAMKEQKTQIEALTAQVNSCCNTRTIGSEEFPVKQTIDLASSDPILYQNQPNPFDNTTVIRYFISENSKQPKIIFQDETGRTINETAITEMGQGSIQINAASLNSGIYTYSLQIDGKIIDSKKMLKSK